MARKKINFLPHLPLWLILLLVVIFLLRLPSFFEPFSYGDEMIYLTLGEGIRRGLTLYKDLHDNKPPLLYFLAAISGNVFWFRAILTAWMAATTVLFWHLAQTLFPREKAIQTASTLAFALLTTLPLLEGQTSNAELFMIGPIILAFTLLFHPKPTSLRLLSAGILFSIATLFKVPAAFDLGAIIFLWLIFLKPRLNSLKKLLTHTLIISVGFALPLALTFLWYHFHGAFHQYLVAAFLQNVGYLSSWRPSVTQDPFLVKNAPLITRAFIVLISSLLLFLARRHLTKPFIFSSLWLLFALFATTLSERPYPHYLLQAAPPISLLVGILIGRRSLEQALAIIPLLLATFTPVYFHFWYYPSLPYYQRFFKFATRQISKQEYFSGFNSATPSHYQLAKFILSSTSPTDKIFVWGPDSSTIYALTRRLPPLKYIASYHIADFSSPDEVIASLTQDKPAFVIILPQSPPLPGLFPFLYNHYFETESLDQIQIWKLANPVVIRLIR